MQLKNLKIKTISLCFIFFYLIICSPHILQSYSVNFVVTLPQNIPDTANVFIAGNFNDWKPGTTQLHRKGDTATINLELTGTIEFKFTRGSWATVEKMKDGAERANRQALISEDTVIHCYVAAWADQFQELKTRRQHTLTGNIEFIRDFYSPQLGNHRTIVVYLPPNYYSDTNIRYPVLYMHDGQNIFDKATSFIGIEWGADETAQFLINTKKIRPIIIVGIYNTTDRNYEYTPWRDYAHDGGRGDLYARFVIETVKPFIDKTYRTLPDRKHTAILGSSLGGLISLYIGFKYPEIFSMVGAMSTSVWWADGKIIDFILKSEKENPDKIYLDIGTNESSKSKADARAHLDDTRRLKNALLQRGFQENINLMYYEDQGAPHNEAAWAKRLHKPLIFFFGIDHYKKQAQTSPNN